MRNFTTATTTSLLALLCCGSASAASTCLAADKYNSTVDEYVRWEDGILRAELGFGRKGVLMNAATCPKLLPIFRERAARAQALVPLHEAAQLCARDSGSGLAPKELLASINRDIETCNEMVTLSPKGLKNFRETRRAEDQRRQNSDYCANANSVERSSAYWGLMCAQSGLKSAGPTSRVGNPGGVNKPPNNDPFRRLVEELGSNFAEQLPPSSAPPATPSVIASAPNPPRQSSGASRKPNEPAPSAGPGYVLPGDTTKHWQGTSDPTDCNNANKVEKSSAFWGYMCVAEKPGEMALDERKRPYTSPIKTQDLWTRATDACKDKPAADRRSCIRDFKVDVLLKEEPNVRNLCTRNVAYGRDSLITCVATVYLYGPKGLQQSLWDSLGGAPAVQTPMTEWQAPPKELERVDLCALGYGLQPGDPGETFGAWTCQPLFGTVPERGTGPALGGGPTDELDQKQAFEQRVNRIARMVVSAIADAGGAKLMSAEDRKACLDEAYAAVRSMYKGGSLPVSEKCQGVANAAFGELAYYASESFDTGNENLLSVLSSRNPKPGGSIGGTLGPPQRGMTGLTPYPQTAPQPAADCAQAETDWKNAEDIKTLRVYEDHLARFPNCDFATLARARIAALKK